MRSRTVSCALAALACGATLLSAGQVVAQAAAPRPATAPAGAVPTRLAASGPETDPTASRGSAASGATARPAERPPARSTRATAPAIGSVARTSWSSPVALAPQPALRPTSVTHVSDRLLELTFVTPNIPGTTHVRVLLPRTYASATTRRYPTLLLLDGGLNTAPQARDWTTPGKGDAARILADRELITVMPDCGIAGWYADWAQPGAQGQPRWESYLIGQLLPWVDATFRTTGHRGGRAVAGLSMGGFGAMSLAARHPDTFVSASSFSGAVDNRYSPELVTTTSALDGGTPTSVFGDRETDEIVYRGHNPVDLAGNLRGLSVDLYTGNGQDHSGGVPNPVETVHEQETLNLDAALTSAGVAHHLDDYGDGGHDWPHWNRDLRAAAPRILRAFRPAADPTTFTVSAAEPAFSAFGYVVRMHRSAREFAVLSDVTASGLRLTGSGAATVTTAPRYRAGTRYRLRTTSADGRTASSYLTADRQGRLTVRLDLCPANTTDQFAPLASTPRRSCTGVVDIRP